MCSPLNPQKGMARIGQSRSCWATGGIPFIGLGPLALPFELGMGSAVPVGFRWEQECVSPGTH